jgi:hypothetical protein
MRALISLYHQSESFITLENLSDRIDQAFLHKDPLLKAVSDNMTLQDLQRLVRERRNAPRVGLWDEQTLAHQSYPSMDLGWSESFSAREQGVIEALYGVQPGGKPGLEVLLESGEQEEQVNIQDDQKAAHEGS